MLAKPDEFVYLCKKNRKTMKNRSAKEELKHMNSVVHTRMIVSDILALGGLVCGVLAVVPTVALDGRWMFCIGLLMVVDAMRIVARALMVLTCRPQSLVLLVSGGVAMLLLAILTCGSCIATQSTVAGWVVIVYSVLHIVIGAVFESEIYDPYLV